MLHAGELVEGYEILAELRAGKSWMARNHAGREVVLKLLAEDCLLGGKVHPSIRRRLERVRELAVKQVANLHGVQRIEGKAYLVWDFIEGRTIGEAMKDADERQSERLGRELMLAVRAMHSAGIVHGAIHNGNVIVDSLGKVWLTDVSPLLWNDEQVDLRRVAEMVGSFSARESIIEERSVQIDWRSVALAVLALALGGGVMMWMIHLK